MIPLRDPVATVKLSPRSTMTSNIPPKEATIKLMINTSVQLGGHDMQCELPNDMLRPGWHVPQSIPE